ncbi:MAG: hypothetical protein QXF26_02325 [Candidatus Bathyarchaeia archaeon]
MSEENHDLLIRLDESVKYIKKQIDEIHSDVKKIAVIEERLNTHLSEHRIATRRLGYILSALSALVSAVVSYLLGR